MEKNLSLIDVFCYVFLLVININFFSFVLGVITLLVQLFLGEEKAILSFYVTSCLSSAITTVCILLDKDSRFQFSGFALTEKT